MTTLVFVHGTGARDVTDSAEFTGAVKASAAGADYDVIGRAPRARHIRPRGCATPGSTSTIRPPARSRPFRPGAAGRAPGAG
ncbi:hypothetical protein [Embleya sp. NPDC020630]|uniref:hypothetical protein n=1 Tax=Embleya sp. NPDC020630 TaxID=3363979 RepID=UPI0037BC320E